MVQTYSLDFHPVAVEGEALVSVECEGAQSYSGLGRVNLLSASEKLCLEGVEIRSVKIPALRVLDFQVNVDLALASLQVLDGRAAACHLLPGGIVERSLHR